VTLTAIGGGKHRARFTRARGCWRRLGLGLSLTLGLIAVTGLVAPPPAGAQRVDRDRELRPLYDPLLGMDEDGRIPKVGLPEDLPEPQRWRYIPEGRIMPGNVFQRRFVTSFASPQIFFQEDVGLGAGIALTDIDFREQRRREFLGAFVTYTTEGQERYRLVWRRWLYHRELPDGGVAVEERSFVAGAGGYQRTLTRRFFGLGPDTKESAESSFTDEVADASFRADLALPGPGGGWIATAGLRGEHHNLARGRASGVPSTEDAYPVLFKDADGLSAIYVTAGLRYDTRDSQHQPYSGWRVGVIADAAAWQSDGSLGAIVTAYGSFVLPMPALFHSGGDAREENPPTDTIALGFQVDTTVGDLPFYDLPSLGGSSTLRGYIANRFTDDSAWHAVAEYRFWVIPRGFRLTRTIRIERVGLALFGELGTVAPSLGDLPEARIHASYGVGLRISLERLAIFRADLGFSDEGTNLTVAFGLSF
jgi:outer membrane protein assembly factor BamA